MWNNGVDNYLSDRWKRCPINNITEMKRDEFMYIKEISLHYLSSIPIRV